MLGIDLVKISRFKRSLKHSQKQLSRYLTLDEIKMLNTLENRDAKLIFLAKTWAVKEAIFKADNNYFEFKKMNLVHKNNKIYFENFEISISHENKYLIAIALKKGQ